MNAKEVEIVILIAAASAVRTAIALRDGIEREPLFPTLRSGLHAGTVVLRDDRYFESALNVAARVAAHARAFAARPEQYTAAVQSA